MHPTPAGSDETPPSERSVYRSIAHVMVLLQRLGDGHVLTVRHRSTSWHSPGLLTVIGGRLDDGEFLDDGAARELFEEVGVRIAPHQLRFCQLPHFFAADGGRVIGAVFALQEWEGEPYNAEPNTHSELVWVDPHDPPADCHPFTQEVLRAFVARDLYTNVTAPERAGGGTG